MNQEVVTNSEANVELNAVDAVGANASNDVDATSEVSSENSDSADSSTESGGAQPIQSIATPALLEALLFANGEPVSLVRLQELMRCSRTEVHDVAQALESAYESSDRGIEIVAAGERLMLRTKAQHAPIVRELLAVKPRRLSNPSLETLSVIAYQQPIVKSEIDKIRGVDVAPTIKTLLERELIKIVGYQASVGQPALYGTTDEFLRVFGLPGLGGLPALRDLKGLVKEPGELAEEKVEASDDAESEGEDEGGIKSSETMIGENVASV